MFLHQQRQTIASTRVPRRTHRRRRNGIALPAVMFAILIVTVMSAAAVQTATLEMRSGLSFRQSQLALYSAEAGLRNTTGSWPTASVSALHSGDSLDLGWQSLPNRATYRAVITRVDNGGLKTYLIVVQGRGVGADLVGGQRTVVRVVGNAPIFKWGVFTSGGISLSGNAGVDSYNSNNGPYNSAHPDSLGSIATNGNVTASGNAKVLGAATANGTISAGSYYTGTVTQHATPLPSMPMVPCPGSYSPASVVSGGSYNAATGVLSGSGNSPITLSGASSYYFSSISISGNSSLTVNTAGATVASGSFVVGTSYTILTLGTTNFTLIGASANTVGAVFTATGVGTGTGTASAPGNAATVYVSGAVSLSGNGASNPGGKPGLLSFSSCGNSSAAWSLSGNATSFYTVYAPQSAITISGNGDLYGAMIGATFTNSGNGKVHFDESLTNTGGTTLYVLKGSWTELTLY